MTGCLRHVLFVCTWAGRPTTVHLGSGTCLGACLAFRNGIKGYA